MNITIDKADAEHCPTNCPFLADILCRLFDIKLDFTFGGREACLPCQRMYEEQEREKKKDKK